MKLTIICSVICIWGSGSDAASRPIVLWLIIGPNFRMLSDEYKIPGVERVYRRDSFSKKL